ncbi:MAG: hypothetical protein C0198_06755 [Sulfurihydrogenibium sp.]|jgi:hypothetical protein|nr:MAG: hypothetical protein C0198_06755 [Sulfurihydrogenibium sp.]
MEILEEKVDRLERAIENLTEVVGREFNKVYNIIVQNDLAAQKRFKEWEERFEREKREWEEQRLKDRQEWEKRFEREKREREEQRLKDRQEWEAWIKSVEEQRLKDKQVWEERFEKEKKEREEQRQKDRQDFEAWIKSVEEQRLKDKQNLEEWIKSLEEQRLKDKQSLEAWIKSIEEERLKDKQNLEAWIKSVEEQRLRDRQEWEARMKAWDEKRERDREEWKASFEDLKRQMNLKWAEMAEKLGTIVEDLVAPNIRTIAQKYFGCVDVEFEGIRVKKRSVIDKGKRREFDFIVACEDVILLNETKSTPRVEDILKFSDFVKSGEFFEYFPEYKNKKLIPIFSSIFLSEDLVNLLTKKGIYALAFKGSEMDLLNYNEVKRGFEEN